MTEPPSRPSIYLAGPMVFAPDPSAVFDRMKILCRQQGAFGVAPLDNQLGLEGIPPGKTLLQRIVRADIELMDRLDGAVFCLDGFRRGPEMDPGSAFEVGYMTARGKPVAGWTGDPRAYPARVADFFRTTFGETLVTAASGPVGGSSGLMRDPDGVLVHSEGCMQNAMIHIGIELAGGTVSADPDWEVAFSTAVACVVRQLSGG